MSVYLLVRGVHTECQPAQLAGEEPQVAGTDGGAHSGDQWSESDCDAFLHGQEGTAQRING